MVGPRGRKRGPIPGAQTHARPLSQALPSLSLGDGAGVTVAVSTPSVQQLLRQLSLLLALTADVRSAWQALHPVLGLSDLQNNLQNNSQSNGQPGGRDHSQHSLADLSLLGGSGSGHTSNGNDSELNLALNLDLDLDLTPDSDASASNGRQAVPPRPHPSPHATGPLSAGARRCVAAMDARRRALVRGVRSLRLFLKAGM